MPRFKIGDHVRVFRNASRKGEIGTVIDVLPTMTSAVRLVQFDTAKGPVAEQYLSLRVVYSHALYSDKRQIIPVDPLAAVGPAWLPALLRLVPSLVGIQRPVQA